MFYPSSLIGADQAALSECKIMGHFLSGGSFVVKQSTLGRGNHPPQENKIKSRIELPEPAYQQKYKVHPADSETPLTQVFLR